MLELDVVGGAFGAHQAVAVGAQEQHRLQTARVPALEAQHGAHTRALVVRSPHVDRKLAPLAPHLAECGVGVDEAQPLAGALLQQQPQLRAVAATEIECLIGAVGVVVGSSLARAIDGVELAHQLQVIGAIVAVAHMPRVQAAPRQRAVDPAAARALAHQPREQLGRGGVRRADHVQRKLDRQRVARRRPHERRADQRAQGLLPGKRLDRGLDRGRAAQMSRGRFARGGARPAGDVTIGGGDRQGGNMLAVVSHGAGALAVVERQLAAVLDKERGGLIQRPFAQNRAGQRVGVRVPRDLQDPVAVRIAAPPLEAHATRRSPPGRTDRSGPTRQPRSACQAR